MKKRWKLIPPDKGTQDALARGLGILPLTARILINRGLVEADRASSFLRPDFKGLHDPFLMKGMDAAVERLMRAIVTNEKTAVYGDYDVDGVTACSALCLFLKELGLEATPYIPKRHTEGYGLNAGAIRHLCGQGMSLVVTVDCGSSNSDEVALANSLGMDVIVTDHHEITALPPALAIINPKQKGCEFPFKGLAGAGVVFNLMMALRSEFRKKGRFSEPGRVEPNLKKYLDLIAIGTVADVVPLVDENRVFVSVGLKELETTARPGLCALKDAARVRPGRMDADAIAYQLAPRINAAGRVGDAMTALRLLTTTDSKDAARLADGLNSENATRQRIEAGILVEAERMIAGGSAGKGFVLAAENWNPGVIGIVASKLADRHCRPVVMIALDGEIGRGSGRGIKAFDMLSGLASCAELLDRFGGHRGAVGLTVRKDNVDAFRLRFLEHLEGALTEDSLTGELELDAMVSLSDIDFRQADEFSLLAPFGAGNREPVLGVSDADITETAVVGDRHLRFKVAHAGSRSSGIGFGLADMHPMKGAGYSLAFTPFIEEWQGTRSLKLRIKDVCRAN